MKKPQKRPKKTKRTMKRQVLFGIMFFSTIFLLIVSATFKMPSPTVKDTKSDTIINETTESPPSNAGYIKAINVDCLKLESAYEHIIDNPKYDVWYANNRSRHFLFINSSTDLTGKSILVYTEDFNYSLTPSRVKTPFLLSYHVNDTLECAIERVLLGYYGEETNEFSLLLGSDNINLYVGPTSPSSGGGSIPIVIEGDDGETEYIPLNLVESWIYDLENMSTLELVFCVTFWNCFFWIGAFYIKKKHSDYFKNPRLFVQNNVTQEEWNELIPKKRREKIERGDEEIDYKKDIIKLGRYLKETESTKFKGYYILSFKHARHFILKVYSKERYADIDDTKKDTVLWVRKEQWEYELRTLAIPKKNQYKEEVMKKTWKNRLLLALGRIIPSKKLPLILYEKLDWEETGKKVTKVLLLRNIYDSEYLTLVADIKFKRLEPTETDPEYYKDYDLKEVPWYRIELLKRDPSVKFQEKEFNEKKDLINLKVKIVPVEKRYRSLFRSSADNEKSKHEFRETEYLEDLEKRNEIIHDLTYQNALLKKELLLKKAKFMKKLMDGEYGSKDKFLLDFKSDLDLTKDFEASSKKALEREEIRKKIERLQQREMDLLLKESEMENPNYVKNLEKQIEVLKRELIALKQGDGRPKKEKDIFDELTSITKTIEEEEEETD